MVQMMPDPGQLTPQERNRRIVEDRRARVQESLGDLWSGIAGMFGGGSPQAQAAPAIPPTTGPGTPGIPPTPGAVQTAAEKQAVADKIRGAKKKKTIEETGTGEVKLTEEFSTDDGKITMQRSTNKYEEAFQDAQRRTAEQQQYYDLLQRAADPQQRQMNLQPVMQFIDQFTGSNLARGYVDPNVAAQQEMANRIRAAGALAKESVAPRERAYKRMMDMANLELKRGQADAARIRAAQGKEPKRINLVNEARLGEGKTIEARGLQDAFKLRGVRDKVVKGLSKDAALMEAGIRVPEGWDKPLKAIMTTQNPQDVTPQKKDMLSVLINEARALKDKDGNRKYTDEDIREQLPSFITDIDLTIAELTSFYGQQA